MNHNSSIKTALFKYVDVAFKYPLTILRGELCFYLYCRCAPICINAKSNI